MSSHGFLACGVASVPQMGKQSPVDIHRIQVADNVQQMGNVNCMPKRRIAVTTPQQLAHAKHQTFEEQSARIAELETDFKNLWQHYASSRKQKLDLLDENASLESEICQLKKALAYETRMRLQAEAALESGD